MITDAVSNSFDSARLGDHCLITAAVTPVSDSFNLARLGDHNGTVSREKVDYRLVCKCHADCMCFITHVQFQNQAAQKFRALVLSSNENIW